MATSVPPIETLPPTSGLSEVERVVDTFVAPSKTFTDIRRSSAWWLPFLISLVLSICFGFALEKKVGWEQVMENQMQNHPAQQAQLDKLTPEQRAQRASISIIIYRVFSYGFSIFGLIVVAIVAGILMLVYNFGFGAQALYKQYFASYMYAGLPGVLKGLLIIVLVFAGGGEKFNIENPIGTNPGFYFATGSIPAALHYLLTSIDFFSIWTAVLIALGLSIVCGVSRNKSYAAIFGLWGLVVLFGVARAAIFG